MARVAGIQMGFSEYPTEEDWSINVFMSGCGHKCEGCQNEDLWNEHEGIIHSPAGFLNTMQIAAQRFRTKCIVFLGGDPLYGDNLFFVDSTIPRLVKDGFKVALYTGYHIEYVIPRMKNYLALTYIKTGRFYPEEAQESGKRNGKLYLASKNQEMWKIYGNNIRLVSENGVVTFEKGE